MEQALKLSKLGRSLERKIKAAFSWNAGNYKTGLGLQTGCQARLGLHRELTSPLITRISLAPGKGARLVAPGTALFIYPQSRYSRMADYHKALLQSFPSRDLVRGAWWGPSAVTARTGASTLRCVSQGWDPKLQGLWKGNKGASVYKDPLKQWDRRTRDSFLCITFWVSRNEWILERATRPERVNVLSTNEIYTWLESLQTISYPPGCLVYCPYWIKI